jgi:hypothetical protein
MYPHMTSQIAGVTEASLADLTSVRLLSCVYKHVLPGHHERREALLATERTLARLYALLYQLVCAGSQGGCGLAATYPRNRIQTWPP